MTDIGCPLESVYMCETVHDPEPVDAIVCLSALNHQWVKPDQGKAKDILDRLFRASKTLVIDFPSPGDPVGGDTVWTKYDAVEAWLKSRWPVTCNVLAERGERLQRTLVMVTHGN